MSKAAWILVLAVTSSFLIDGSPSEKSETSSASAPKTSVSTEDSWAISIGVSRSVESAEATSWKSASSDSSEASVLSKDSSVTS